ncbi:MAG TPA: adenylate/guanylate cyclase domain-containing protein [Candidatus Bathyarchaeia archaeon]|nr:adenylate/guanylate cyclase domain-containing protein [Candidatus Bathyarchaeia archaeon]
MGLPTGPTVTFLFTDIEGSTRLERALGSAAWATVVGRHDQLLRDAIEGAGGVVVKTEGDAFFAAFDTPAAAASAAVAAQRAVAAERWPDGAPLRVRMGLHLGEGRLRASRGADEAEDYVGIDVNYAARIAAVGNGGQIVLSDPLAAALRPGLADDPGLRGVELADEGLRAVKDFEEPARLHRLVVAGSADDARPLRTIEAPSNLPGEVTALVGRAAEIDLLRDALLASRIVTLTGPGGSGKTRLALGVARTVADRFPHGVWFVDLAALGDPALLESAIATTLGIRESPERSIAEILRAHLRDRTVLLLLDNLEQLLPSAADVVSGLLRAAPDLRILVTSRELLRISGERGYTVPPLDVASGVALFEDRARSHRPDLVITEESRAAIQSICERLGGLPLAIELAAARVRTLSPSLILERLGQALDLSGGDRDVPERQRTLRGAITWSHDLLPDNERCLFRRLAVFAGGWTIEAAQAVGDPDGDLGIDLVDGLESLSDKSLVRIEPGAADGSHDNGEVRFGQHPLLREYALERLTDSGERAEIEARHAAVFATLAEAIGPGVLGPTSEAVVRRLDREAYNIRAAVTWSLAADQPGLGLRILGSTWRWFQQRGRLREGRALLGQLLARPSADVRLRIAGLAAEGGLAYWMDDAAGARAAYEERFQLASGLGDPALLADAHYDLGFLAMVAQDGEALRAHEQSALDLYQAAGNKAGAIRARQALVLAVFLAGDYAAARELEEENYDAFRRTGSQYEIADSVTLLSAINFQLEDPVNSWRRMAEGMQFFSANDSASGLARGLAMAAMIQLRYGDPELGARAAAKAYELVREQEVMLAPVKVLHLPDPAELAAELFGADRARELLDAGAAVPIAQVIAEILAATPPTGPAVAASAG